LVQLLHPPCASLAASEALAMQFRGVSHGAGVLAVYELDEAVAGAMACLVLALILAVVAIVCLAPPPSEGEMVDIARQGERDR
jgi:putative effector of murein hydrolase